MRVMVIDPNPNTRHHLKDSLRGLEIVDQVMDRGSPHGLLELLAEHPVHVIMIDEDPGAGNVYEIIKLVKSKRVAERIQFIMLCSELDDGVLAKGRGAGARAFVKKPYDMRSVENALMEAAGNDLQQGAGQSRVNNALQETLAKLRKVPIFTGFNDQELVRLLKICRTRNYAAGAYIFKEGDPGLSLFVIVAGKLEIRKRTADEDKVLVQMGPGACFGEVAIIDDGARSADAKAATPCTVIEVNESVVNNNEDIISLKLVRQIAILLARKLRAATEEA